MVIQQYGLILSGDSFDPYKVAQQFDIKLTNWRNNLVSPDNCKASAWIRPPEEIFSDFDNKWCGEPVSWLLDYIEDKVEILRNNGVEEIQLDMAYLFDPPNDELRYCEHLTVEQLRKMSELQICFNICVYF